MTLCTHLWLNLLFLFFRLRGHDCFGNVTMTVDPPYVENGKHVVLGCHYDLQGDPLYTVKWYRGTFEFYRFSPVENPSQKVFPFQGIHVDRSRSNATAVYLRDVGFRLAGNVSCEVTTDSPGFKTKYAYSHLQVISLPRDPPKIRVDQTKYKAGDTLSAECTSSPSRPAVVLNFFLHASNNLVQMNKNTEIRQTGENLFASTANFSKLLYPGDFLDGSQIVLKCVAKMDGHRDEATELRIGTKNTKNGDPVPERVTSHASSNGSSATIASTWYVLYSLLNMVFVYAT